MASIQVRNSIMAITPEVTEGTPVTPTAVGDYVALQDDLSLEPSFEKLESNELRASIGSAKTIVGAENPTASFSHYLKHSGTEGTAPQFNDVLKALFGSESVRTTERNTVAGSTVSVINVDSGEGDEFDRGHALLIKATNGYEIRPVHSVATDAVTLGFDLNDAPDVGVDLGKSISYLPVNSAHQTLSLWHYAGNGGATQMIAGVRPTEISIDFTAGQLINMAMNFEGIEYYFNPIEITASTKYIDFTDDDGTFAVSVATGFYKDPHDLAVAVTTAMNGAATSETHAVTYSNTTGKYTIESSTSTLFSLLWNTGDNAANSIGAKLGYAVADDDTGATSYLADAAISFAAPQVPTYDSSDPLVAKSNEVFLGDNDDITCIVANTVTVTFSQPKRNINSICAASGVSGSVAQSREVTISISALLDQYDAEKFRRYRENEETRFMYNAGTKSGGNWQAGKCVNLYAPTTTISSFSLVDNEGLFDLNMELKCFVGATGLGEFYLNFL